MPRPWPLGCPRQVVRSADTSAPRRLRPRVRRSGQITRLCHVRDDGWLAAAEQAPEDEQHQQADGTGATRLSDRQPRRCRAGRSPRSRRSVATGGWRSADCGRSPPLAAWRSCRAGAGRARLVGAEPSRRRRSPRVAAAASASAAAPADGPVRAAAPSRRPSCRAPARTAPPRPCSRGRPARRRRPVPISPARQSANRPSSLLPTSTITPRPNCAGLPVIARSVVTVTLVATAVVLQHGHDRRLGRARRRGPPCRSRR